MLSVSDKELQEYSNCVLVQCTTQIKSKHKQIRTIRRK